MEIDVIEDRKNPLLKRREIVCVVTKAGATPSKKDVHAQVSAELKLKPECLFVDAVHQRFGRPESIVRAKVYDTPELVPGYVKPEEKKEEQKPEEKEPVTGEAPKEDASGEKE